MPRRYDAVLFDLLSALLDSWSLWDDVAGDSTLGRAWRLHCLEAVSRTERYEPYLALIGESAKALGLSTSRADVLASRWRELSPWPEATEILSELAPRARIGVISNCSEALAVEAASRTGAGFDVFLTAERAGYYKPDPRIYEMAISELGVARARILYVAGSPYDVRGAAAAGMSVFWHNRAGIPDTEASARAEISANTLFGIRRLVG